MAKKAAEYGNDSISMLKGPDRVRKRPAVIFGSDGLEGCEHSFFEILSNSIDEAREGYGDVINVTVHADCSLEVEDFGRGVPLGFNEKEKRYNWELVYCELYAGGKYNNDDGEAYEYSLGLNGLGACATQYSSEYMNVVSYSKNGKDSISFRKGEPTGDLVHEEYTKRRTGTLTVWKPDLEVFTEIRIPYEYFTETLRKQAVVNAGLRLNLKFEQPDGSVTETSYLYPNGIVDYVKEMLDAPEDTDVPEDGNVTEPDAPEDAEAAEEDAEDAEAPEDADAPEDDEREHVRALCAPFYNKAERQGRDRPDMPDYKLKMEAVFCFSNSVNRIEYFHNSSFLEHGGSPDKAARSAFVKAFDAYLKNTGKYTKNESRITFGDIEDSLILVTNSHSTRTSYANQTKKAITNTFIAEAMTEFFLHSIEVFTAERPKEAERVAKQILINKRSRENAENARINLKKKLSSNLDIASRVEKFVSCRSRDPQKRELYIVEGDSALGSVKLARDAEYQAVIPVRGKTLNCLKCGYDKIFKNDITVDLLKVIGCGVEIRNKGKTDLAQFDLSALKWSKIVICTDADEDGYQIRTLILTMLYRLLPTLIREGKIYIAETPLYEITWKGGIEFAYNEKEKNEIVSKIGDAKYTLQRSKGLGENDPEMMSKTTMNPKTRRLIKIVPADESATETMFNTLLGDDAPARKRYIAQHGAEYVDLADI